MENIYNWVFWYNFNENTWYAIHRDSYIDFFSDKTKKNCRFHKNEDLKNLIQHVNDL